MNYNEEFVSGQAGGNHHPRIGLSHDCQYKVYVHLIKLNVLGVKQTQLVIVISDDNSNHIVKSLYIYMLNAASPIHGGKMLTSLQ